MGITAAFDYFHKKYDTAYTGVENVGFIAYNTDNLPVAYYGVIPCFMQYGNTIMLAAQSADTMTHPRHRYKGMFVELSNMTFDPVPGTWYPSSSLVFPNQNSYHGAVNKLGWKMTGTMTCFTIPVKSLLLESFSKRSGIFNKLYKRYCRFILNRKSLGLQGVANSVLADGFAGVNRRDEYMLYKTYSHSKVIRMGDSKIWINNKHGLVIGDIEGINEMNFKIVINKLKGIAKRLGIRQIHFIAVGVPACMIFLWRIIKGYLLFPYYSRILDRLFLLKGSGSLSRTLISF